MFIESPGRPVDESETNNAIGFSFGLMHQAMDQDEPTHHHDNYRQTPLYPPYVISSEENLDSLTREEYGDNTTKNSSKNSAKRKSTPPPRPPPPKAHAIDLVVGQLQVNKVRWFYRDDANRKWVPFIGYDTCQLEWKYRKVVEQGDMDDDDTTTVLVRGGLYEVDILHRKCSSVYWSDDEMDVMRGTWFYHASSEPLDEGISSLIERKHLDEFKGQKIPKVQPAKGPKQVLKQLQAKDYHIDWNSIQDVFMYSNSKSSRIARSIGTSIGLSKVSTSGYRIVRGYQEEATLDDKPPPVSHLVFVVHGVGQIMDKCGIIKSCSDLRRTSEKMIGKHFPDLKGPACTKRIEFLPVQWRSSLSLDGGSVLAITPQKLKGLRHMLNSTGMDILYYTSPLYRSEIVKCLHTQLCQLYARFCSRNPGFIPNGGKVSIFAHSLGSVIVYDIMTGWNPIHLYDQYLNHEQGNHPDLDSVSPGHQELAAELNEARKRVAELEDSLLATNQVAVSIKSPKLDFQVDSFFCIGSPLGVFLVMRGFHAQSNGCQTHIIPKSICKRVFNIYHPADPIAYRLEPLMQKHYATINPLPIHRSDSPKKIPYEMMRTVAFPTSRTVAEEMTSCSPEAASANQAMSSSTAGGVNAKASVSRTTSFTEGFGGILARFSRAEERNSDFDVLEDLQREMEKFEDDAVIVQAGDVSDLDSIELEQRVDFELRQSNLSNTYISALTSHSSYWSSTDLSLFMLTQMFPEYLVTGT